MKRANTKEKKRSLQAIIREKTSVCSAKGAHAGKWVLVRVRTVWTLKAKVGAIVKIPTNEKWDAQKQCNSRAAQRLDVCAL